MKRMRMKKKRMDEMGKGKWKRSEVSIIHKAKKKERNSEERKLKE